MTYRKNGLRSYGPGKFTNVVDSYVYDLSLDGWADEEMGDVETFNFYSRFELGAQALKAVQELAKSADDKLTMSEAKLLRKSAGCIIEVHNNGFVYIEYFPSRAALDKQWTKIEKAWDKFEGEGEGD
jgi:hypothetical protein